ncbi:MAG: hypothetical protein ACLRZ6_02995 [Lachnospiraceae bacterium]
MEEAAKVIGGVAGELVFFMRSFLLGFLMRLGYEPIIFFRRVFRQQSFFWTSGCIVLDVWKFFDVWSFISGE